MPKMPKLTDDERELGKALAERAKLDPSIVLEDFNVQHNGDTVTVIFEVFHKMPRAEFEALAAAIKARQ